MSEKKKRGRPKGTFKERMSDSDRLALAAKAKGVVGPDKRMGTSEKVRAKYNKAIRARLGTSFLMGLGLEEWPSDSP
jgi:hypothetical protein